MIERRRHTERTVRRIKCIACNSFWLQSDNRHMASGSNGRVEKELLLFPRLFVADFLLGDIRILWHFPLTLQPFLPYCMRFIAYLLLHGTFFGFYFIFRTFFSGTHVSRNVEISIPFSFWHFDSSLVSCIFVSPASGSSWSRRSASSAVIRCLRNE